MLTAPWYVYIKNAENETFCFDYTHTCLITKGAQSAGAVEYTDCTSAKG